MGIFGRLFGGAGKLEKADALFDEARFGQAKLAYERALSGADDDTRARIAGRIEACCDGIAEARITEAERQIDQGAIDLAEVELAGAIEVANDPAIRERARKLVDSLDHAEAARELDNAEEELDDEAILSLLASRWEEEQAEEYEATGDALFDALVMSFKGEHEAALEALTALTEQAKCPRYLWLELGRCRLSLEDTAGAREALTRFLDTLDPDEGGEARLGAHVTLANLADDEGDFERAMAHLGDAVEAFDNDHRPYLVMGQFLHAKELYDEAIEVLRSAAAVMDEQQPDWRVLTSLGLALRAAGQPTEATKMLEEVMELFSQLGPNAQFPADAVIPLAELHEEAGKLDRAADLWSTLGRGAEPALMARACCEAGRLLTNLGLSDDARRQLTRAEALAEGDDELRERVRGLLEALPDDA